MLIVVYELKGVTILWEDNGETVVVEGYGGFILLVCVDFLYLGNVGIVFRFLIFLVVLVNFILS